MEVNLKPMPDGFGFIYDDAVDARGETRRINIMPPLEFWRGDIKLDTQGPDETQWVLYVDGDEVARSGSRADIDCALESLLQHASA